MVCLNLTVGAFATKTFSTANAQQGKITITRNASQLFVAHDDFASSAVFTGDCRSVIFGGNQFAAVMVIQGTTIFDRKIFIVDFTGGGASPATQEIHSQGGAQSSTPLPAFATSPGGETAVFAWSPANLPNEIQNPSIYRSDTGDVILAGPINVSQINGTISAEVTASDLVIHHPNAIGNDQTTLPRPAGKADVLGGSTISFGEAVIGSSTPGADKVTKTAQIKNTGNDCLTIQNITDSAPFALTPAARAQLPLTLQPNATASFDIVFAPTGPGNNIARQLAVTRSPANGDSQIAVTGNARTAEAKIAVNPAALAFGTLPHPSTATKTFTVTNTGDINVTVTIPASPAGSSFAWPGVNAPLAAGASLAPVTVTFTTPGDLAATPQTITITPSQGAAKTVACTGRGCLPNAEIVMPGLAPLNFAEIERGFRTVRLINVANAGDGDLTFTARIGPGADPAQAANFGIVLPENDIADAPASRGYSVAPQSRCGAGATGTGTVPVAVSFHALGPNGIYAAELIIEGHNATNVPAAQTWTFPLSATVIDPVPVDVALVLDRSGSMADPIGSRNKMEAALAGGQLLVRMLRETADDRCALIAFETDPAVVQPITPVAGNSAAIAAQLSAANFTPGTSTNIAGGAILGAQELATPHPAAPPVLKKAMVVLTDGQENRCFQQGGAGPWLSITGRDTGIWRPDNLPPGATDPWQPPPATKVYAIGLGAPGDIDSGALTSLATATGASFQGASDLTGQSWFLLEKYFTQIFMETAGLSQLSDPFYTIQPGTKHVHEFDVMPGDVTCMIVLYDRPNARLPFYILTPKGEMISSAALPAGFGIRYRSSPTARFVDLSYPAKEPDRYAGRWQVIVEHAGTVCAGDVSGGGKEKPRDGDLSQGGFQPRKCYTVKDPVDYGIAIGAGSNLRLQPWVDPDEIHVGESFRLNAVLTQAGLPVTDSTVVVKITGPTGGTWTVGLKDDGLNGDGGADDGDYGGIFSQTYAAGYYQLTFIAEGALKDGNGNWVQYRRESHRSKAVLAKGRTPPKGDDWCRRLALLTSRRRWLEIYGEEGKEEPRAPKPLKGA